MRGEGFDQLRVVPFNLPANNGLQFPVLAHQTLDTFIEPSVLRIEVGFETIGNLFRDLLLVTGERLSQVFNEAVAFAANLFGVNAALGLAEGHEPIFMAVMANSARSGPDGYCSSSAHRSGSDMAISRFRVAASLVIVPHQAESHSRRDLRAVRDLHILNRLVISVLLLVSSSGSAPKPLKMSEGIRLRAGTANAG